ncbi:peptidoglycan DD-metalloendopeptidase family protein [Streptomyces sp. WMMC500]|uniref:M23 family metallopeptidase n=1 Tax=Streptomyces sp. WMMC500 TaxID=3015154 RepID=UPI00248C4628|nr:M23 family metallopeptidase [Streptomyces sp. WMMC500]WBB61331.1 peptidoglycan DD-metalloendopeptidase family protein [Streptomyces sp. WMMC500]
MSERTGRGRHRRYRPGPVSRASLTVTASGAGLALPLVAGAATPAAGAPADSVHSPAKGRAQEGLTPPTDGALSDRGDARTAAGDGGTAPQGGRAGTVGRKPGHHEVVAGETLSGIADQHRLRGGWPALYERNRGVVGADPDLILPGQRLTLRGGAAAPPEPRADSPAPGAQKSGNDEAKPDGTKSAKTPAKAKTGAKSKPEKSKPRNAKPERTKPDAKKRAPAPQAEARPKPKPKPKPEPKPAADYTSPLAGAPVGTPYGASGSSWSSGYHTGVDFPVSVGTGVRSVADGEVVSAGWAGAYGYEVVIRHRDGRYSQYAHLSAITVSAGRPVNAGQRIGRSGSTGNSTGPHLHFEVRTGPGYGSDVDPLRYLRGHGVRI